MREEQDLLKRFNDAREVCIEFGKLHSDLGVSFRGGAIFDVNREELEAFAKDTGNMITTTANSGDMVQDYSSLDNYSISLFCKDI